LNTGALHERVHMKILIINKYDITGGAAIAAMRIAEALQKDFGVENHFLVGIKRSSLANVYPTRKPGIENFVEKAWNYMTSLFGYQYIYFPFSTKKILTVASRLKPDIIHLHNLHGGYFDLSLLPRLSQIAPLVWTLHDMWAITAHAAHSFGNEHWKTLDSFPMEHKHFPKVGISRPEFLFNRKKRAYARSNLTIVTPSKWLYQLVHDSPLLHEKAKYHIPNGVDMHLFTPGNKSLARKKLGLPQDKIILTFTSEKLMSSEYKGGKEFMRILEELDKRVEHDILMLMIGKDKLPLAYNRLKTMQTGYIANEELLIAYLQATDIYIYPTKADNLPNSLIEAIACGVPCITFDVGGCNEIIQDHFNGYVIPPGDIALFAERITSLIQSPEKIKEMSIHARKFAEEHFNIHHTASKYFELFTELSSTQKA